MKKILFFTSVLFLILTVELFAQQPINLQANNITHLSADFSWDNTPCSGGVKFQYRVVTSPSSPWNIIQPATSPYSLTGLTHSTDYQWTVKCVGSSWAPNETFTTLGLPIVVDSIIETTTIACAGGTADITAYITQTTPPTQVQFLNYRFISSGVLNYIPFGSGSGPGFNSQNNFGSLSTDDYLMLIVDPVLFASNAPNATSFPVLHSDFIAALNDPSILGYSYYTVDEPDQLVASTSVVASNICPGDCIASEELTIAGGTQPYNYILDANPMVNLGALSSTETLTNLCEATYNVVVSDANGCSASSSPTNFTIANIAPIVPDGEGFVLNMNGYNVSCAGVADGRITASATGGTGTFEYSIDGGTTYQSSQTFSGLLAGSYTITYKDANGCIETEQLTLNEPPNLSGTASVTNSVACFGGTGTGEITFQVDPTNPGVGPYSYSLDNFLTSQTTAIFINLVGDSLYEVTVRDNNTCQYTSTVYLADPLSISHSATISSNYNSWAVSCNGDFDGEITVSATGGTGTFTYSIDGGLFQTSPIFSGLSAGSYTITYKDANGCTEDTTLILNEPPEFSISYTTTDASCPGPNTGPNCDGEILIIPSNGVGSIVYNIETPPSPQVGADFLALCAGSYDVDAMDANGCIALANNISISEPPPFDYTLASEPDYCELANGEATINYISGGTGTWTYLWDGGQTSATVTGLSANPGTYTVTVTDANACQFSETVSVASVLEFNIILSSTPACFGTSDGAATVTAIQTVGGTPIPPNFEYQWSDINGVIIGATSDNISNMPTGTYSVVVIDADGCEVTGTVIISPVFDQIILDSTIVTLSSCFGIDDAQIEMFVTGGVISNYEYSINGVPNSLLNNSLFELLAPNTYTLEVTDGVCSADTQVTLAYKPELEIDTTIVTHISCLGANDGYIQAINVLGGTAPFEYSVDGSINYTNMAYFTGYSPGTYTVEVTDANNCVSQYQGGITIIEPTLLEVDVITSDWNNYQIRCHGGNSGYADIDVIGGTSPYSKYCYDDNNNGILIPTSTNPTVSALDTGIYTFEVIDANGCTYSETITYNEPSPIAHNFIPTHVTCSDSSNGSLTDVISGGVGTATSYIYQWNTAETTYSLTGIPIGTYIMTVKDENNCIDVASFTINDNDALNALTSVTDVSCYDYCDGAITTIIGGGSPDYDASGNLIYYYQWDDVLFQTTANAVGLCADNLTNTTDYSCVITDGQGCEVKITQTINQEDKLVVSSSILNEITCHSENDGKLTANVTGGNGGDSFLWNNWTSWASNASNNNLIAGNYVVIATDANGCMDTTEITLIDPPELSIGLTVNDIKCYGMGDGKIIADASGGTPILGIPPKYDYSWSNSFNEEIDISTAVNLSPGIYNVTATDKNGCTITSASKEIKQPANPLTLRTDSVDESCNLNDGQASFEVEGGTLPYFYTWTNGLSTNPIINLSPGSYIVTLTDKNGCEVISSTFVNGFSNIFLPGNLSMIDTTICLGESFFIDIEEKPGLTYQWENGSQQADRLVAPTNLVNTYNLTITDPNCASVTIQAIINVSAVDVNISTDNPSYEYTIHPVLSFNCDTIISNGVLKLVCDTVSINTVGIANGSEIELFSDNNNCDTYNWAWLDNSSATKSILVSPEKSGWYFIDVEKDGCLGLDSIYVIVSVNPFEAFTPGDDDFNDTWKIVGIEKYNNAIVQVFNRWGAIVFETPGGQAYEPWDGTNNGKELPIGTYYYMIDLKNGEEPVSGPVTIIR